MEIPGYTIERLIAKGGTASVYLAVQDALGRRVALKVLDKLDDAEQSARFLAEGKIIAGLNHRNINTLYDVGRAGKLHYLAMEYLEGGSLAERIEKGLRPEAALDLLETMADCLRFLHERAIIHRDVKPANILFHADGTPILTDFGIAKQLDSDQQHTLDGTALGSPYYLSPEQAAGRTVDARSDIYSLGIVFYEMLTGHPPYRADSHVQTMVAHLNEPVPVLPEASAAYQPLLERMAAKEPDERFGSAAELLGFIRGLRLAHPERQPGFWLGRNLAIGAVAGGAALLVLGGVIGVQLQPAPEPVPVETATPTGATQPATETAAQNAIPAATGPAPQPKANPDPVTGWLAAARLAASEQRLTFPAEDSALYYYRRVLEQQPDNAQAEAGIRDLVTRYHGMAERALERGRMNRARRYVQRGLNIDPAHAGLRALKTELAQAQTTEPDDKTSPWDERGSSPGGAIDDIKAWWKRNFD